MRVRSSVSRANVVVRWAWGAERTDAHLLLRRTVAEHERVGLEAVELRRSCPRCGDGHGRPMLTVDGRRGPWGSLARAGDLVVVAVSEVAVGVDVELLDGRFADPRLVEVVATSAERARLEAMAPRDRAEAVARTWVRKESVLKCTGHGLEVDPRRVELGGGPSGRRAVRWTGPGPRGGVRFADLPIAPGVVAAVACRGRMPLRVDLAAEELSPG